MKPSFSFPLACLAAFLFFVAAMAGIPARAQGPAASPAPQASPQAPAAPRPPVFLPDGSMPGAIFHDGFESPAVAARTPLAAGGDIAKGAPSAAGARPSWAEFSDYPAADAEGSLVAGLTPEVVRAGKQALYVEAKKLSAPYVGASFVTRPIALGGVGYYKLIIWARNDAKKPLITAVAQLFLTVQLNFYAADGTTEVGMSQYLLQPLPGGLGSARGIDTGRQTGKKLVEGARDFKASGISTAEWTPVGLHFGVPPEARTMVATFRCNSSSEKGQISGGVYFDDVTVLPDIETAADIYGRRILERVDAPMPGDAKTDAKTEAAVANIQEDPNAPHVDESTPEGAEPPAQDADEEENAAAAEEPGEEEDDDLADFQKPTLEMPGAIADPIFGLLYAPEPTPVPSPTPAPAAATPAPGQK